VLLFSHRAGGGIVAASEGGVGVKEALCHALLVVLILLGGGPVALAGGGSPEKNNEEGSSFLMDNKNRSDVITTGSGLQYLVLVAGSGPKPQKTDSVTVHYRGTLIDGTEFDNSRSRGEPASFPLAEVIPGWTEALQLMPVGSIYRLFIPPELAYGARGAGLMIGPNQTLLFEVELLAIEP